jgi:hypothetical protein
MPPAWPTAWEKEASDGRAEGGDEDEEEDVGVGGGEDDEEDVGDAGDGKGDEGAVDCRDGEQADDAEVAEEVDEAVMGGVLRRGRRQPEGEERGRVGVKERPMLVDMTLAGCGVLRENYFYADKLDGLCVT